MVGKLDPVVDDRIRAFERDAARGDPLARRRARAERLRAGEPLTALAPDLRLSSWNALEDEERLEVAQHVARALAARGMSLTVTDVGRYGPASDRPIARLRDERTDLVYALVPGGTLAPGLDARERARVAELERELMDSDDDALVDEEVDEEGDEAGGWPPRGPDVEVAPFLLATTSVPLGCAALERVVTRPDVGLNGVEAGDAYARWVSVTDLPAALRALGARLPTPGEVEWAARGGSSLLFPWGDDLAFYEVAFSERQWDAPALSLSPANQDGWPGTNAFGLRALGGASFWVGGAERLGTWGGAGESWPWQSCGEWRSVLPGVIWPRGEDPDDASTLRPVIGLA